MQAQHNYCICNLIYKEPVVGFIFFSVFKRLCRSLLAWSTLVLGQDERAHRQEMCLIWELRIGWVVWYVFIRVEALHSCKYGRFVFCFVFMCLNGNKCWKVVSFHLLPWKHVYFIFMHMKYISNNVFNGCITSLQIIIYKVSFAFYNKMM